MSLMRCVVILSLLVLKVHALAPWADSKLPVTNDLVLWLDAVNENAARKQQELPPVLNGAPLDCWHDAAAGRHVVQATAAFRPRLIVLGSNAMVRFDGADDFLADATSSNSVTQLTLILCAAARTNPGGFRAFFSMNRSGRNDYTSGLNLDLGGRPSSQFDCANVEGAGFSGGPAGILGESNLLKHAVPFGQFHVLSLTTVPGEGATRLYLNGQVQGSRSRQESLLAMDELTIGARRYSHEAEPAYARDFLTGDIAELLVFNRLLPEAERLAIEKYLKLKHEALQDRRFADQVFASPVFNPPPVQVLVPGFSVRELPLDLNNINNLRYRADGKLFAVGYDGNVWLLSDTDGDTLEDKAEPFWDKPTLRVPMGAALTPPNYPKGDGLFLPCVGKVVLLVDTNRDDRADEEIGIAQGWTGKDNRVDSLGIALDKDGNIYFGLGIGLAFLNAYRLDKAGNSGYDIHNERGTILKVSPDFSRREIICTGIRFPVGMAFNRRGDLFCTDQEGATWLPNGNPFDELLHIEPGRHYGFPPRHPKHLPDVIDEPSVFDYTPQHQSTCGLNFNESVNGGPVFGPAWWAGDALVAGESRGKIWRTKLAKTHLGYVAQTELIACLTSLAVDVCVSPRGDLVVAAHGGNPDWGTGPTGKGKLYQIRYLGTNLPQPVLAWNSNPTEFRVAFDRPLDSARLRNIVKQISLMRGKYVTAGDRFETVRPGYQVVQNELAAPRFQVPVLGVLVSPDNRELVLRVPSQHSAANYSISLPDSIVSDKKAADNALPRHNRIDIAATMNGVETEWRSNGGALPSTWNGWLPHLDFSASREFTGPSSDHERFWSLLTQPGTLTLRTQLDLSQMLQPAVQPGSELDYEPPLEKVTVTFSASVPFTLETEGRNSQAEKNNAGKFVARLSSEPAAGRWFPIALRLITAQKDPELAAAWHTAQDSRPRALQLRRFFLPWAQPEQKESPSTTGPRLIPELAGGVWERGRDIFFSEQAACHKCHQVQGKGGRIGPDLSNLEHRDYASVLKDIIEPNAAINPDHLASNIELKSGDTLTGVILTEAPDSIVLGDAGGLTNSLPKSAIARILPSTLSLMPEGLLSALSQQDQKDLLTFLLMPPKERKSAQVRGE